MREGEKSGSFAPLFDQAFDLLPQIPDKGQQPIAKLSEILMGGYWPK
jgi:hypothetical protein